MIKKFLVLKILVDIKPGQGYWEATSPGSSLVIRAESPDAALNKFEQTMKEANGNSSIRNVHSYRPVSDGPSGGAYSDSTGSEGDSSGGEVEAGVLEGAEGVQEVSEAVTRAGESEVKVTHKLERVQRASKRGRPKKEVVEEAVSEEPSDSSSSVTIAEEAVDFDFNS